MLALTKLIYNTCTERQNFSKVYEHENELWKSSASRRVFYQYAGEFVLQEEAMLATAL